jgi:predicted metal-dependent peptidase
MPFDITKTRTRLLLDQPFFGTLLMHVNLVDNRSIPTLRTNGEVIEYNGEFMATLTAAQQTAVMAHEVMHNALLHPYRRGARDPKLFNIAADHAVNILLADAGFHLPDGVLIDPQFKGMSAEQIYSKLQSQEPPPRDEKPQSGDDRDDSGDEQQQDGSDPGAEGDDDPSEGKDNSEGDEGDQHSSGESVMGDCRTGEFVDAPSHAEEPDAKTEQDWQLAVEEAVLAAQRAGHLPGGTGAAIKATHEPVVDWKAELQAFIVNNVPSDVSWSTPNRRFISSGLYLPGAVKENVGPIVVAVDTSGSVSQALLDDFGAEITGLLRDARPEVLHVIYCDTKVHRVDQFDPDDTEVKLEAGGRGGTAAQPVFDHVETERIDPLALVYLTDLELGDVPTDPGYPVMWVTPAYSTIEGPFGQTVRML